MQRRRRGRYELSSEEGLPAETKKATYDVMMSSKPVTRSRVWLKQCGMEQEV